MDSDFELLPIGDSRTLFLHKDDTGLECHRAVQVTILADDTQRRNIRTTVTYTLVQEEISELITKLVTLHLRQPLPESFIVTTKIWSLHASRKPWFFGQRYFRARWGNEEIVPFEEKWKFIFNTQDLPGKALLDG
ncbi:hypothetical protein BC629DRAFT_1597436 [Irpex lacteus]|nr:hypothetical protein BC629DRAFT_1597436 [Irpex lacteus]